MTTYEGRPATGRPSENAAAKPPLGDQFTAPADNPRLAPITDPECAYIGALLNLPLPAVAEAARLLVGDHLADSRLQVIYEAVTYLISEDIRPDPAAVLAQLRAIGTVTTATAVQELSLLLVDLYGACPVPASAPLYAAAVLDEALRRRCTELATRVAQAARAKPLDSLVALVAAEAASCTTKPPPVPPTPSTGSTGSPP